MKFRLLIKNWLGLNTADASSTPAVHTTVRKLSEQFSLPAQWVLQHEDEQVAHFQNAMGDLLTINYFPMVPDIEASIDDIEALRAFYRRVVEGNGLALIETELARISNLPAVRTLFKGRLEQIRGFAFIGSYTLPFADCSFVIKVQSVERGITGVRECAVMLLTGATEVDDATGKMIGWEQDPYNPEHRADFMRNLADDAMYDDRFPEHPLSKVRSYLEELAATVLTNTSFVPRNPFVYVMRSA
jgi:hypothetical protein